MAELPNTTSTQSGAVVDTKVSELQMQSETASSSTHLLERNVKQIHIKEESTVKKVLRTREIKQFNAAGEEIYPTKLQQSGDSSVNEAFSDHETGGNNQNTATTTKQIDDRLGNLSKSNNNDQFVYNTQQNVTDTQHQNFSDPTTDTANGSNYQNITATINANNPSASYNGMISNQQPTNIVINQPPSGQPFVQPILHSTNRAANLPQSGYEELDSTLGFNSQEPVKFLVSDQGPSNYGITKAQPQTQQHVINQPMVVQQEHGSYDVAYGRTGLLPQQQIPIISSSSDVYGIRNPQEPVYAINRNGNLTFVAPDAFEGETDIRWRDPDLEEVIGFMSSPDPMIRANSVAYLQHLSFGDDNIKQRTRLIGGIPILIELLSRDILEVQRNVCGALRNLSYGRKNDDNKRAIRDALGLQALSRTLINNSDNETRELATSVLWNLSSCEDIKWSIIDDSLATIVSVIIVPYTAWFKANLSSAQQFLPTASETHWSTVFRNSTGVLRNISSAGAHARKQLRECDGLIESLFFIINVSISRNDVENKLVENCVCILRNLSYRCQETQDPDYERHYFNANGSQSDSTTNSMQNSPSSPTSSANLTTSLVGQVSSRVSDNLGCFSFARKSKSKSKLSFLSSRTNSSTAQGDRSTSSRNLDNNSHSLLPPHHPSSVQANSSSTMVRTSTKLDGFNMNATLPRSNVSNISPYGTSSLGQPHTKAQELLWQPEVVKPYLALLSGCSNSETLEAAAGAIQNLAACYWQPSIDIRASVRKERGLPVLVELLRMDRDRVVCVVATALRNLAIDQKNKDLIGKYAMLDLVNKLASNQSERDSQTSDDTIAAVLATLHEVISNNIDFVRSLYESGGLNKLNFIIRNNSIYSTRVQRFAAQVLLDMWKFTELREMYKKGGWKESHFIVKPHLASKNSSFSVNSNTIERPIASQQADRSSSMRNLRAISNPVPMNTATQMNNVNTVDLNQYPETQPSLNAVHMATLNGQMNNPLYAQVDRHRKRNEIL